MSVAGFFWDFAGRCPVCDYVVAEFIRNDPIEGPVAGPIRCEHQAWAADLMKHGRRAPWVRHVPRPATEKGAKRAVLAEYSKRKDMAESQA